ncbi:MAG TPA: YfhO family protein, partial [Thermoanaerobaculia bacterium]|nr:YfhO family protein [Thermoanaerobaculia bacterium]
ATPAKDVDAAKAATPAQDADSGSPANRQPPTANQSLPTANQSLPIANQSLRFFLALGGALTVAALLAAPMLVPFAEAVTKSKRYMELQARPETASEVPFSDYPSAILLLQPRFWGKAPIDTWGAAHAESISGFAGYLGVVAWFALLAHVIARRAWRSRETFLLLATILVLGVILSWPGIGDAFHLLYRLAANARMRLLLVFLLAALTAALIDLIGRDRRSVLIGLGAGSVLLLVVFLTARFHNELHRDVAVMATIPSLIVLAVATIAALFRRETPRFFATLAVLAAVVVELWSAGREWNPVVSQEWMYPKPPILRAMDELKAKEKEPFRISANSATLFPNSAAVYGLEDVRAHDPMANGRYITLLTKTTGYDAANYFAEWKDWDNRIVSFLNVKYVITSWRGELPPRFRVIYEGNDGRIFENTEVLPRFYAVRNVVGVFDDDEFDRRLRTFDDWHNTALLDSLELESQQMHDDFFHPRPADSPRAVAKIVEASPTSYRIHVKAPRWSLVASSVPWWPGWKVERNGVRIEPIRVNGAFLGFAVPEGELDVRVWYDPWTFRIGAIVSLATLLALIAYRFAGDRQRRHDQQFNAEN